MEFPDSIKPSLQNKFQTEKLFRTIKECDDINLLREIAIELLKLNSFYGPKNFKLNTVLRTLSC